MRRVFLGQKRRVQDRHQVSRCREEATIPISDEVPDMEAARRVDAASGAVTFGYNPGATLRAQAPDLVFDDYADFVTRLTA